MIASSESHLLMHFNVEAIRHLVVHDLLPLNFGLLLGQFFAFQFQAESERKAQTFRQTKK